MKKNVLIVNNTLGDGGAEKILLDILDKFNFNNYNVKLLILNKKGIRINDVNSNVKIIYLYPNIDFKNKALSKLWNCFKYRSLKHFYKLLYLIYVGMKNNIEIAFLEGEATRFIARSINKKSKKIAWVHTDLEKCRSKLVNEADREVYNAFDEVICVSEATKLKFEKIYKDLNKNVSVIYNFIDEKKINVLSEKQIDEKLGENLIIGVGRLTKIKGFDNLIKAGSILKQRNININIVILGIGEEYNNLKLLAQNLGIEKNLKLIGFRKNPYPYIKKAKICVMTSQFEGYSLVMAESMVLGKAIISTNHAAAQELLDKGKRGILVKINDEIDLANAIENIINDENKIKYYEKIALKESYIFDPTIFMEKFYEKLNY